MTTRPDFYICYWPSETITLSTGVKLKIEKFVIRCPKEVKKHVKDCFGSGLIISNIRIHYWSRDLTTNDLVELDQRLWKGKGFTFTTDSAVNDVRTKLQVNY
jgi:hypothetical protein